MPSRRSTSLLLFLLLSVAVAAAQNSPPPQSAPSFSLAAPSSCVNAQSGYTCKRVVNIVNWTANPDTSDCGQLECHLEYCFGQHLNTSGYITNCNWTNRFPATYGLPTSDGYYTVYGEYRVIAGGQCLNTPVACLSTPAASTLP